MNRSFRIGFMVISLIILADFSSAQRANQNVSQCGAALVSMKNPSYLITTNQGIIAVELPKEWVLDKSRPDLFYILKKGGTYESARTLMYIHVEALNASLKQAVLNDIASYKSSCEKPFIEDLKPASCLKTDVKILLRYLAAKNKTIPMLILLQKLHLPDHC